MLAESWGRGVRRRLCGVVGLLGWIRLVLVFWGRIGSYSDEVVWFFRAFGVVWFWRVGGWK